MSVPIKLLWTLGGKKGPIQDSRESTASIDASDSLNWNTTPMILAICTFIIGGAQAFGEPITCIHPVEIKHWKDYLTAYCYLEGSYTTWENTTIDQAVNGMKKSDRDAMMKANPIEYYQWVPYVVAFQLVSFIIPGLFWKWARKRQALDLDTILAQIQAIRDEMGDVNVREEKMKHLVGYLYEILGSVHTSARDHHLFTLRFLAVKLITMFNVIFQFLFIASFIGDGIFFGFEIMRAFADGLTTSRYFPLEVLCDLSAVRLANTHQHTMQCYLSLNFFHDKMFVLLWAWYLILMVYSMVSFLLFLFSLLPLERSIRTIVSPSLYQSNEHRVRRFYNKMLFTDGMVLLKFISKLKGHHLAVEIADRLFIKFEQSTAISAWIHPDSIEKKTRFKVIKEC